MASGLKTKKRRTQVKIHFKGPTMGEQRDAYTEKFKAKLDDWNADIDRLQAKANGAQEEVLVSYNKQIEALKSKRDELKGKMTELQQRGDDAWEDMREGLGTAWKVLGDSIESAKARFK
jgi:uncharacterized coiled-coil DUF342 family protein